MSKPNQPSKPRQLIRKLITIHSAPGRSRQAVISVIPIAVSLVTMGLIVSPTHAAMGMIGAMGALAGNNNAPLSRARILFGVGTATIFSQCLGLMSVQIEWLLPIILASWSLIVIWVWHALQLGPPGPLNILFAAAFGTYMASRGWTVSTVFTSTVPSFLIAAIVSMIIILASPHRPVRAAVKKAENAVNAYCEPDDDADSHEVARLRSAAHAAIHLAWWAYNDGHSSGVDNPSEMSELSDLRARLITAHMRLEHELRLEAFPSADVSLPDHVDWTPLGRPKASYLLRTALERGSRPTMVALRAATGVFFASLLMILLPFGHPYWAVLSVLIMIHMDATRSDMTIRAIHRVLGTVVGLGLYLAIAAFGPSGWVKIGLIIVFLWAMQALHLYHLFRTIHDATNKARSDVPARPGPHRRNYCGFDNRHRHHPHRRSTRPSTAGAKSISPNPSFHDASTEIPISGTHQNPASSDRAQSDGPRTHSRFGLAVGHPS